jgi:hypothetical protein
MGYKLDVIFKNSYLHISVSGSQTLDGNIKLAADCVEACKKYKVSRVLVDIRGLSGQPGVVADYELAKLITAWESAKTVSHAALLEKESDLGAGKFFETTARNRGINIYVFSDPKKAEEWINA